MKRPRKPSPVKQAASLSSVATPQITNALPASTGVYRSSPRSVPWSSKQLERIMRSRDLVQISRFLQSQEGIPQVNYAIQQLPREAVGKGIGMKSTSLTADFKRDATALFRLWAESSAVDIRKEQNFFELQPQWLSTMLGDGECFQIPVFEPAGISWSLRDKSKRAFQIQTISRDQLTNGDVTSTSAKADRWMDGLRYNGLDQLTTLRLNQDDSMGSMSRKYLDIPAVNNLGFRNVFHLKDTKRLNQYHGDPAIFASAPGLLDYLDLTALRKHSAKVRAGLLGATITRDGKVPNAMQAVMRAEETGTPAADTGRRFVQIGEGAVFIPLADSESFNFFNSTTEAVPFKQILEDLLHPFIFELKYPPEWIFMRGKVGGVEYRGLLQQVSRAHEGLRSRLYPLLQWVWEKVIGTAMMEGGPLAQYAAVEDWNAVDFVTDPDPTVDAGRDHRADMERLGENILTPDDVIERLTGADGTATRREAITQKLDLISYAITEAAQRGIPASIATVIALGLRTAQSASGMISTLAPENIAADLTAMDAAK